jgi:hypothetical protein
MNKMKKLLVTVVAVIVLALGVVAISSNFTSKGLGEIQVELVDLEGNKESKTIVFNEGDTLVSLIEENYDNVVIEDGMLMSIEDFTTARDWSTFISINVDDEMSMLGIKEIEFTDGTKISFIMTEFIYD